MSPPAIRPMLLNQTRMNLPNLEELSFLTVLALPYASVHFEAWSDFGSSITRTDFVFTSPEYSDQSTG